MSFDEICWLRKRPTIHETFGLSERRLVEAKAEADILLLQIKVEQEQDDARFLANLKRQAFSNALGNQPQLPAPEADGPNKSRLRRLDTRSN